jgi:hypothetical protein
MNKELQVNRISDRVTVIVVHNNIIISIWTKSPIVVPMDQLDELYDRLKLKQLERRLGVTKDPKDTG